MRKILVNTYKKHPAPAKTAGTSINYDSLRLQAFDNAAQANIISSVDSGKIIIANSVACKLLGYPGKQLLTKSASDIFNTNSKSFLKNLRQRKAGGHNTALVIAIKKNGKLFPAEITYSVFTADDQEEKAIITFSDRSQSILDQTGIDIRKEKIVAANIVLAKSKQKKIDTKNEKIVTGNIASAKSRQKKIDTKNEKIVTDNIASAKSRQKKIDTKNEKIVTDNIASAKSKQRKLDTKNEKIVAGNIMVAKAKSDGEKREQEIAAREFNTKNFKLYFNSSSDVLFDSDLITNEVLINDAYEKDFGYKIKDEMKPAEDWINHIHPDDKQAVMQDYNRMLDSAETEWMYSYRFLRADNTVASVLSRRIILRNSAGKAYRMIGSMQDISKQKVLEERLEQEIKLKEMQIADAAEEAKETERSDIGRELHDNVNQLLGVSKLYLDMAKHGGDNSEMYIRRSTEYTVTAIEEIRKLSKELTSDTIKHFGLCEAIKDACRNIMEIHPVKIIYAMQAFDEKGMDDKFRHNVFRIIQEQLNNILKHASATTINISLSRNDRFITMTVSDNGVGFDTGLKRKGIGVDNIRNRAASCNGTVDLVSQPGHGCVLTVKFPVILHKLV